MDEFSITEEQMYDDPAFWAVLFSFGRKLFSRHETDQIIWKKNYDEYINSNPWKIKSREAKQKADWKCQVCNSDIGICTHHRSYENLVSEKENDLIVLCSKCHALFHQKDK